MSFTRTSEGANCIGTARSVSRAVLLLTTVALLNGCGGGASESGAVPATISCIVGPAATVLNWDPVGGATGYRIYSRTASGNFTMLQQVGNTTTLTVNGLVSGTTYYFVATAIDGSSNESSLSNVVCKSIS